jgi:hypothetical protein
MSRYPTSPALVAVVLAIALTVQVSICLGQAASDAEPAAGTPTASAPKPDYDAAFVGMKVPEKVITDQVFPAAVTFRNTGAKAWWCEAVRLRFVGPRDSLNWGTNFILIRQGFSVKPGAEYTFRSYLKAPSRAGKVVFQWQVNKDGRTWFGERTPARTIQVDSRPAEPATAPAPAEQEPSGKKVLTFEDFEYVGSFKPPKRVKGARGAFSESGLALRETADGAKRLFMNYTHPAQVLFQIEIPPLVKVQDGRHAPLKVAEVKKIWGTIRAPKAGQEAIGPNGGFVWDEGRKMLYWTSYHGYKTGAAPPVLGASKLEDDGGITHYGPWYIPKSVAYYKSYWGGATRLSKDFADKYTGGRTLALGFGGYYSICAPASRGPALGAISEPDPAKKTVDIVELLYYGHGAMAPRDGDYLNANCGFWGEQPDSPTKGYWTYDDWARAGVFVDSPAKHGYIAFVRLGTGRMGYDFGAIGSAGQSQQWYVYDPADLGKAAKGLTKPYKIVPRSMTKVRYPLGSLVTGSCYDEKAGLLYLCTAWAYNDGERESYPCVHVYRLR